MNIKLGLQFCTRMVVCGLSLATLLPLPVQAQTVSWKRQLGTSSYETSSGVATDSNGNVYISGSTEGSLGGANQGDRDAWVAKYNTYGELVWKRQLGTSSYDYSNGVATDSKGNIYISGVTSGSLAGANQGSADAWVAKYNTTGALVWKRQLGSFRDDYSRGVATDSKGNIYISGYTNGSLAGANQGVLDAWVAKYNTTGALVWKRQLGTSNDDSSQDVAIDSKGNVYISGETNGSLAGANQGEHDAWVAKYNTTGALVWKRQLGTSSNDLSRGVATDSKGNIYISGYTRGSLAAANQGDSDAWVAKYNTTGALVWKKQLGSSSSSEDVSHGVATDSKDNIYISGTTLGSLGGADQGGASDAWLAKYNTTGALVWKRQLGSFRDDYSFGVEEVDIATDSNSNVYISGNTDGSLGGANQGFYDAWVAKYSQLN
jgi:uncharacterized delta-60 repeat protein